jgi:uncharacterized protein YbjT (DUF2867 family)
MTHESFRPEPTILVTGAAGLNGSAIIREFERNRVPVRALVRSLSRKPSFASSDISWFEADMLRPETLTAALDGVERVILISSSNLEMVETQCSFIDACKKAGVPHVIKFSGEESGIGFNPEHFLFGKMHEEIEDYLENSGLAWTHLRPCQFMQVYLREALSIKSQGKLFLPLEEIRLSPVDIEDIAKVAFALLHKGGYRAQSLGMTGPEALSMEEIAAIIGRVIDKPVQYIRITPAERHERLLSAGLPLYLVDAIDEQTAERLRHPDSKVDLSTHALFGVGATSFEQFVRRNAAVFGGI